MTTSNEHNNAPAVPQGDEHAAFKSAMKAEYGLLKFDLTRSQGGGYQSLTTHAAYQGWKVARAASPAPAPVGLTDEGRQQVFIAAERRMVREPNLSWRDAIVDEVIAALRAKGQS